jgi:glycosyltransferase involved in cell wall biosynthesis
MNSPLVSVIIPVYNRENLIGECIESVLEQTMTDFEIIIFDNASTDNTGNTCQKYADNDRRIKVFRNDINIGPVRNWQNGLTKASGIYTKMLFSDDLMAPRFLEETVRLLQNDQIGFVFTACCLGEVPWQGRVAYPFEENSTTTNSRQFINAILFDTRPAPLSPGCALFRTLDLQRNLLLTIPSPSITDFPNHGAGPDLLCYLLTAKDYPLISFINQPLTFFRAHPSSITVSDKDNHLGTCYDQAKIWFANEYLDKTTRQRFLAKYWSKKVLRKVHLLSIKDVFGDFLFTSPRITLYDICDYYWWKIRKFPESHR